METIRNITYSIVTGGAGGLGKAFAFELASKGFGTILIDLPGQGLDVICNEIKTSLQKRLGLLRKPT
jgi:NAD(P)-dependent dehydrogenase (short-subunit alcohol dehydrogenase family)